MPSFATTCPCGRTWASCLAYQTHKHTLYGQQEGLCAGCQTLFPIRNLTIDHVVARSRGGSDHLDNLQLLCGACNSTKGAKTQEEFLAISQTRGHPVGRGMSCRGTL